MDEDQAKDRIFLRIHSGIQTFFPEEVRPIEENLFKGIQSVMRNKQKIALYGIGHISSEQEKTVEENTSQLMKRSTCIL